MINLFKDPSTRKYWYRFESVGSTVRIYLQKFRRECAPPKDALVIADGHETWVRGGKRLCHETKALALESFIARKKRANSIMQARIDHNLAAIRIAEHINVEKPDEQWY